MIFAIIGHSASGKSSIERKLQRKGFTRIISYTTREPRSGEVDGIDYHYISNEKFIELKDDGFFTETAQYREWNYGLSLVNIDYKNEPCVVVVTPKGYYELIEKAGEEYVKSIFVNVSERERMIRLANRGDDIDEIIRRIHADRIDFDGFKKEANFIINNLDLDESVNMSYTIIKCLNK